MTLGRTSSGAIKIKTDGGLRAVECACCGPTDPCRDCPPVLGDWNFSFSGDQVTDVTEFEYETIICPSDDCGYSDFPPIAPRVCLDSWDAYGTGPYGTSRLYMINLIRASGGFSGLPAGSPCCWILDLYVQGFWEYQFDGFTDVCGLAHSGRQIILNENPVGSYDFTFYVQCLPTQMQYPPFPFNFTVIVS